MKKLFTAYPHIDAKEFMGSTKFWLWLKTQDKDAIDIFTATLKNYLSDKGFKLETHYIKPEQLNYHKHVFNHFHWSKFEVNR